MSFLPDTGICVGFFVVLKIETKSFALISIKKMLFEKEINKMAKLFKKERQFIEKLESAGGTPLYELSPEEAREVLLGAQDIEVEMPNVKINEIEILTDDARRLRLEIIKPAKDDKKLPVVYYIHGGGWVMGDNITHRRLVAELAEKIPAAVAFPIYTQAPEGQYPSVTDDLFSGLKYIVENGNKLGVDASRLAVAGDSVGGNMAAVMTLMAKVNGFNPEIKFQLLFYPVTNADFMTESYVEFADGPWLTRKAMEWFWAQYLPEENKRQGIFVSPLMATPDELKGLPPVLIITDENDVLRDEGEAYARKLDEAGVETACVRFNGTIHDFVMLNALAETTPARTALLLAQTVLHNALYD